MSYTENYVQKNINKKRSIFSMIFSGIILVFLITCISANIFWEEFISELILSFSPYILCISTVLIVYYSIKFTTTRNKYSKRYYAITIFLCGIVIFTFGNKIRSFYNFTPKVEILQEISESKSKNKTGEEYKSNPGVSQLAEKKMDNINKKGNSKEGFSIFFANIYWKNKNTQEICKIIQEKNPDIIALVEFSLLHKDNLYQELIKTYPYTNINQRSEKHAGNIVFSKFPIENLVGSSKPLTRRYNYIALSYQGVKYYIYLVHTSAPRNTYYFNNRNRQLRKLINDISEDRIKRPENARIIIMGDFNITPRSGYYRETLGKLGLENLTKEKPFVFTRNHSNINLIKAHIDHILMSKNINWGDIDTTEIIGSDHRGFIISKIK